MIKRFIYLSLLLVFSAFTSTPPISMRCNINVDAGPDIVICRGQSGMLNGMVSGDYDDYEWSPPTGLDDPFDLNTGVSVAIPTIYTLTARGVGDNIIQNPGFENGSINPATTSFNFVPQNSFAGAPGGSYTVGTSATFGNIFGCSAYGGNYAMAYNGSGAAGAPIWCQTVPVNPNSEYKFEMYFMGVNIPFITSPPSVNIEINGSGIAGGSGGATCAWNPITGMWNSGAASMATICINNSNGGGTNIGVIDDISLRECCVVEDQVMVDVVDIQAMAQPAGPITCDNPQLILNGAGSSVGAGYTYEWSTSDGRITSGRTTLNPTIGEPGTYTLTVFGPGGCEDEVTIVVEGSVTPPDVRTFTDILTCDDPNARVGAQSGVPNVDYQWTGPNGFTSFDQSFTTTVPGKYFVRVEDPYNCFAIDSIVILDERDFPDLDILGDTISCGKDSATLEGISTSWNLTYSWEGPNMIIGDSNTLTTGDTGVYILTVVDSNDCVSMDTFKVIETDLPFNAYAETDTIDCNNTTAILRGFSDSTNVTFTWSGPNGFDESGPVVTTVDSGTYILTVNFQGCEKTDTIEVIKEDGVPELELMGDTITCLQDSALLIGGSTTPGATLNWTGPNGFTSSDGQITVREDGFYVLTVTGANGCMVVDSFKVTRDTMAPSNFSVDALPGELNCLMDSSVLFVNGQLSGVNLEWNGPSGPVTGLPRPTVGEPGTYILTVTGDNGCFSRDSVLITADFDRPQPTVYPDTITCASSSIQLRVDSDVTAQYSWTGPNGFMSNDISPEITEGGVYQVILTGDNGCDTSVQVNIPYDTIAPNFDLVEDTLDCSQPSVFLTANTMDSGMYTWIGPNAFMSNNVSPEVRDSGWYTLIITGDNGCATEDSVYIERTEDTPDISATGDTLTCAKDSVILEGFSTTPMVQFNWTGPNGFSSTQATNVVRTPGDYTFTVINMTGCSSMVTVNIAIDTVAPIIDSLTSDGIPCDSNSTTIRSFFGNDVVQYNWSGPGNFSSNLQNPKVELIGWYRFTAVGENGCSRTDSIYVVAQDVVPDVQAQTDTLTCKQTEVDLIGSSSTSNVTFQWTGPNGFMSGDSITQTSRSGTYTLTVQDENGCTGQLQIDVPEDLTVADVMVMSDTLFCQERPVNIDIYTVPGNAMARTIQPNGTETDWKSIPATEAGVYRVIVEHPRTGCRDTVDHRLVQSGDTIQGVDLLAVDIGCMGDFGRLEVQNVTGGQGPFTYALNNGPAQNETSFENLVAGNYTVFVQDIHGCEISFMETIEEVERFTFSLPPDMTINKGESVLLEVMTDASNSDVQSVIWTPEEGLSCTDCLDPEASPLVTTTYTVEMTDVNGCSYTDEITIFVQEIGTYYVPNAFSPNGDNLNDIFMVYGNENAIIERFAIYDRWGEQIFLVQNGVPGMEEYGWDGTFNGERVLPGVYVFEVLLTLGDETTSILGDITVLE